MEPELMEKYSVWCRKATLDPDLIPELKRMDGKEDLIADAFYRDLEFGTAGLRGVIGAGTNRMNVYTVGRASQGLANYVRDHFEEGSRRIAVSYDSRIKSTLFAKTAAAVFAANDIEVYIYPELMPVPCLSYATRALKCSAGVMITASHNPSKYNGYKVYGADGCQITTEAADTILSEIMNLDTFKNVKFADYDKMVASSLVKYVPASVYTDFIEEVKKQSVLGPKDKVDKNVALVYTPLNGSGYKPVTRIFAEAGYTNVTIVKEQKDPDGNFPTCPYPNPEIREAMALGMEYMKKNKADLLIATDPDADRCGTAVLDEDGNYVLISGNEMGVLLLDYICDRRTANKTMPEDPVAVKSIVTTDMAEVVARSYGVKMVNVLTGFKFIGDQIAKLEEEGKEDSYIFGYEESYGYLSGTYVRDKDAVNAAFLICEMFCYYKAQGISIYEKLQELYEKHGFFRSNVMSFEYPGIEGAQKMKDIMASFREKQEAFGDYKVLSCTDYMDGIDGLPPANVLKFTLDKNASVIVRPSGTEPKVKIYVSVCGTTKEDADLQKDALSAVMKGMMN
ncbi:MAG: phospho-sugar mutase [Lachnospiraceae bacterium]|nr:phospho-sugar mutase [Lachnospiraceae bacterium]